MAWHLYANCCTRLNHNQSCTTICSNTCIHSFQHEDEVDFCTLRVVKEALACHRKAHRRMKPERWTAEAQQRGAFTETPSLTKVRTHTANAPTQKVAVSEECGRRPPALSKGRLSLIKTERQIKTFESERCILHKGRKHSHEDRVADRGFHWWHHYNLVHTRVPISKNV